MAARSSGSGTWRSRCWRAMAIPRVRQRDALEPRVRERGGDLALAEDRRERDGDVARRRDREDVGVPQAERPRVWAVGAAEVDLQGAAVPRGRIEDRFSVRAEACAPDGTAPERELSEGRRRTFARAVQGDVCHPGADERRGEDGSHEDAPRRPALRSGNRRGHLGGSGKTRERLEVEREVARRVETLLRVLLEAVTHDPLEPRLDAPVRRGEVRRVLAQDRRDRLGGGRPVERPAAREHLVEDRAEREDVRSLVGRVALHLLGRHVAERPHHDAGLSAGGFGRQIRLRRAAPALVQLREAEVEDLDPTVFREEEILGLEVAVDDPFLVRRCEAARDLNGEVDGLADRQRASRESRTERLALQELHDEDGTNGRGRRERDFFESKDGRDVRMVQGGQQPRFPLEAFFPLFTFQEALRQDLDRNLSRELRVLRSIDLAHPARTERSEDLVGPETRARGECHRARRL